MITLKLSYINDPVFNEAMEKLDRHVGFTSKTLFDFNKLKTHWDKETKRAKELFLKLLDKHVEKETITENGKDVTKFKTSPDNPTRFVFTDEEAFHKDVAELLEQTFEIKCSKLPGDEIAKAGLSPHEIRTISPILDIADGESEAE